MLSGFHWTRTDGFPWISDGWDGTGTVTRLKDSPLCLTHCPGIRSLPQHYHFKCKWDFAQLHISKYQTRGQRDDAFYKKHYVQYCSTLAENLCAKGYWLVRLEENLYLGVMQSGVRAVNNTRNEVSAALPGKLTSSIPNECFRQVAGILGLVIPICWPWRSMVLGR